MRPDPLSALRYLEALNNKQLREIARRVESITMKRAHPGQEICPDCNHPANAWLGGPVARPLVCKATALKISKRGRFHHEDRCNCSHECHGS